MSAKDGNVFESSDLVMNEETVLIVPNNTPRRPNDSEDGRVLRARHSLGNTVTAPKRKRARTFSESTIENHEAKAEGKKQKLENKKANTIVISAKKVSLEAARRRWLHRHRLLFLPLLPTTSALFDNIAKEIEESIDTNPYVPLHQLDEQPKLIEGGIMKDYQLQGLSFLVWMYQNGMSCILGDEMGLGKTLQTLSLLAYIKENSKGSQDPHLIVCPLSVLSSWQTECARWVPSFRTVRFHGQQSERERLKSEIRLGNIQFDVCITTYDSFVCEDGWFKSRRWTYCVLDEGHKIKNSETNLAHRVQGIGALYRLILTGTPVQNNLVELWGLLHWLYPSVFTQTSERLFKDSFDLSRGKYSLQFLKAAQELLSTIMLRRTKATVEMSVPPREELTVFIPMTEAQRFWTYRLLTRMDTLDLEQIFTMKVQDIPENQGRIEVMSHLANEMKQSQSGQNNQYKKLMNLLMQLRKVCDHPYLLSVPEPYNLGEHIVASSSKIIAIDKLLVDILPTGERVLIFSQWTGMLDMLEDFLEHRTIPYARLDGSTHRPRRTLDIKLFQQERSPYKVFLISTKAGGLGINLTKATHVIMCDSDWNPQNDLQAIARAHRIGQTKTVKVYRLICRGSVEDQMLDRIRRKLFLSVKVMGGGDNSANSDNLQLGRSEVLDILRKGSSALSRDGDGMDLARFLDAPIGEILDFSRSKEVARDAKIKKELNDADELEIKAEIDEKLLVDAEAEERELLSGVAQVQSRLFEGKVVTQAKNHNDIAHEWQEVQKKARVGRLVMVDGTAVLANHLAVPPTKERAVVQKRERTKFESEDYCNYCRDGGELVLCYACPRVFHAKCHGMSKAQARRQTFVSCSQHSCVSCQRTTAESGGMLFRCQTCPQAFCEDCLPEGEIDAIGDVLPEFILLGYSAKSNAYYIRCHDCHQTFIESPEIWKGWKEEMRQTQLKLDALSH